MKKSIIVILALIYSFLGANMIFAEIDTTPDRFTFTDKTNAALSTEYKSNAITVAGINTAASISITGGTYSINGGTYTSASGTVSLGNTVKVRKMSAAAYSTTKSTTLTIGGISDTFSVTTLADTQPDAFTFTDRTDAALSTEYKSNAITVSGIGAATSISITGGTYSVNGGTYTSVCGTVNIGNTVKVRKMSAATYSTTKSATLTIGGVSDTFSVTTVSDEIDITITSPTDGANITGNRVIVTGSIANPSNVETGVTINGIPASISNSQFAVNNVPLAAGQNTITITATDTDGTTATKSITVNAATSTNYIILSSYPESGTAPMEITLRINGSFTINNPVITATGPGAVEQLASTNPNEYKYKISTEGVYYFTAQAIGPDNNSYQDTIAITALPLAQIDTLLRSKWGKLTTALTNKDIATALTLMHPTVREKYQIIFNLLMDTMPTLIAAHTELVFDYVDASYGYYELSVFEDGVRSAYRIVFAKDEKGLWLLTDF